MSDYFPLTFSWLKSKMGQEQTWQIRKEILDYYSIPDNKKEELEEPLQFIRKKGIRIFPYSFIKKYSPNRVKVYTDKSCGLNYTMHCGHRLYFPENVNKYHIKRIYTMLLCEQDSQSPHCYTSGNFQVEPDDIVIDVGAAEGNFSLSVVEKAKKIYLFEMDELWRDALKKTFEPWKHKVEIINKYVSSENTNETVSLDTFAEKLKDEKLFIKLDVEGAEKDVLEGAKNILSPKSHSVKMAICTYHNQGDHKELSEIMKGYNYDVETSNNYMLFHYKGLTPPYFRKGLIRCRKKD